MFGGLKKTDDEFKNTCFRSYKLAKPLIKYRNFKGQKKAVSDQFGSATIRPSQFPSDAIKRLLRSILTSRHLEHNANITNDVHFEVVERVPIDANGKPTDKKSEKKGLRKYIYSYKGHGVKATKQRFIKMKNGRVKPIKTLFASVKLIRVAPKTIFTKTKVERNIHKIVNKKKIINKNLNKNLVNVVSNTKTSTNNNNGNNKNNNGNNNGNNKNNNGNNKNNNGNNNGNNKNKNGNNNNNNGNNKSNNKSNNGNNKNNGNNNKNNKNGNKNGNNNSSNGK